MPTTYAVQEMYMTRKNNYLQNRNSGQPLTRFQADAAFYADKKYFLISNKLPKKGGWSAFTEGNC